MLTRAKQILAAILLIVLALLLLRYKQHKPVQLLKPGEAAIVTVENHRIVITKRKGKKVKTEIRYVPKEASVTLDENGQTVISIKQYGLDLSPGLGIAYSTGPLAILDVRLAYYKHWGLNAGLGARNRYLALYMACSYHIARNVSIFGGVDVLRKEPIVGLRVEL